MEFDHTDGVQLVEVSVCDAVWSTWRRYCDAVGVTMGRGNAGLVDHELGTVFSKDRDDRAVLGAELERKFVARTKDLDARERRLDERDQSLRASERRLRARTNPLEPSVGVKVGRNEPCPWGSGFKHKRCRGR